MTLTGVTITQLDGAIGVLPPGIGDNAAIIAPATSGAFATPTAFGRKEALIAYFGAGPLVELGAYLIKQTGKPVTCVRSNVTTSGGYGTVLTAMTGTSVPTADATTHPIDEYEPCVEIVTGGTIGTTGITYQWSLDNGRTNSATIALGTANSITVPGNVGVKFNLASGTMVAGDVWRTRTTPPLEDADDFAEAFEALRVTSLAYDFVVLGSIATAANIAEFDAWLNTMWDLGKSKWGLCSVRGPNVGESEATYRSSLETALSSTTSIYVSACGGYARTLSSVSSRQYRRPVAWVAASRAASSKIAAASTSLAQVDLGPLPADVRITDQNGNPCEHNEEIYPGLDALRLLSLRTRDEGIGVYIEKPRIISAVGSDFDSIQYRKVMNRGAGAVRPYFTKRLQKPIRVDAKTGFILEEEALEIESGANAALRGALLETPDASAAECVVARNENILASKTLHADVRIVPLAYPNNVGITIGFENPANRIVSV